MANGQRTFLGHPVGLYVLFFTEMWERFSYYGMRALLILYMVNYFRWEQKDASQIYKVYTSFVYVTPILGGFLADRYLGNRIAVIIGAILMAIGHFLMAFEQYEIFISALIFLMIGNGFFKPNMSTQVGRLYPANDGRRDGAYTIFYMGINLGAFLAPIVCGWLAENTVGGYHSGFTMAGIGMLFGLTIYLVGQPFIKEIDPSISAPPVAAQEGAAPTAITEGEAARTPSTLGIISATAPLWLTVLGAITLTAAPIAFLIEMLNIWDAIMLGIGGLCLLIVAWVCSQVQGGVRDRVLAIMSMGVFVIFFWAAFEQAGNVLNLWADKTTNRYLTQEAPLPNAVPEITEDPPKDPDAPQAGQVGLGERFSNMFKLKPKPEGAEAGAGDSLNPVPTTWFLSINALGIFAIAPIFAWLWVWLDKRGRQPSIPMKMTIGLILMSASVGVMVAAAKQENKRTEIAMNSPPPESIPLTADNQLARNTEGELYHAGRLVYDEANKKLIIDGVLPDNEKDRIIAQTAPKSFVEKIGELKNLSEKFEDDKELKQVSVTIDEVPPGFDMKYSGIKKSVVSWDPVTKQLTAYQKLAEKEEVGLKVAAGETKFRDVINRAYVESSTFRVSAMWLVWAYLLATLGELCLSPVGLSMVSKLAPAKFATMLMGCWMLTSSFGNFVAGSLGEVWGTIPPVSFFLLSTIVVGIAGVILFIVSRWIVRAMHGVK